MKIFCKKVVCSDYLQISLKGGGGSWVGGGGGGGGRYGNKTFSAFDVMVQPTRSSLPRVPHTWMFEKVFRRPPELGFEGHTGGSCLLLCLMIVWAGLQEMY